MDMITTAENPPIDATLSIDCEAGAHHKNPHTPNAITETMGQHIDIQEHPLLAGQTQTPTYDDAKYLQNFQQDTEKGTVKVPEIANICMQSILHIL